MSQSGPTRRGGAGLLRLLAFGLLAVSLTGAGSCKDNLGQNNSGPQSFRISIAADTVPANGASSSVTLSADGLTACFASRANNLASPTSGFQEIFVRDRALDTVRNATQLSLLTAPAFGADCNNPYMSSNGQFVVFESKGGLCLDPITNPTLTYPGVSQLYVLILTNSPPTITWLTNLDQDCTNASISDDGRWVAFETAASNVTGVSNAGFSKQVYVLDTSSGFYPTKSCTLISHSTAGATTICNYDATHPRISGDGSTVVFHSQAQDLTLDANPKGYFDNVPTRRIYAAAQDGTGLDIVSRATDSGGPGAPADNHCGFPSVSGDGRYVAFYYQGGTMVPGTTGLPAGIGALVRRDRTAGVTDLAATDAFVFAIFISYGDADNSGISDDGRYLSYCGLNSAQTDLEVKVRDMMGGTTSASHHIIDPILGFTEFPRSFLASGGHWVAWQSDSAIEVVGDTNGVKDVFGFGPIP